MPVRALLPLLLVVVLAACSQPASEAGPPEGWQSNAASTKWWKTGTDTTVAFRDLSLLESMGVARDESEFISYVQGKLLELYRTDPETVDSVFAAEFLPRVREGVPAGPSYEADVDRLVNDIKRDFYQRYNNSRKVPGEPLAVPDDLQNVTGEVEVEVYVGKDNEPLAVRLLRGTGTALDLLVMRNAATGDYTDAWVRPTAGQSAGVRIPSWVRITQRFGA